MAYNILIVDDSVVVRKMLIKALSMTSVELGQVFEANNGREGLAVLEEKWVDLIFLDINMPVMNGMEFMTQLRMDREHASTPVIVVSTEGSQQRKEELRQAGVQAYLRKPVSPESLVEVIESVLGGHADG